MVPLVSVIVVNYNGRHLLEDCLGSLVKQGFRDFETILVDNGSTDGSVDFVSERYPDVRTVRNPENLGFGGGVNAGLKHAEGRYIALLNNDAVAHEDWLGDLAAAAMRSSGEFGIWASKILSFQDPETIDTAGHLLYPDGLNIGRGKGERDSAEYDREEEVLIASGCAAMFLKDVFDTAGGFDEDFFAYGDDTEMGLRARLMGWKCLFVPSSVVYHKGSETMGRHSPLKAYYIERNRIWVLVKCFPLLYILLSPFYTALRLFHHVVASAKGRGAAGRLRERSSFLTLVKIFIKANLSALLGMGKMIEKRREISRNRKVSSREFSGWLRRFGISASEISLKE
jgi:GT2 family glycosyltransferase